MCSLRVLRVGLAIALVGCGSTPPPIAEPEQSVDEKQAQGEAKSHLAEIYRTLNKTNTDGLMTLVAEPLVVFGPRKADAMATRADAIVALREFVDEKKRFSIRSGSLVVTASPGGHSAWAVDQFVAQNQRMTTTAILSSADELWAVDTIALASIPTANAIKASLGTDAVVPPASSAPAKTVEAASAAAERFVAGLANPKFVSSDMVRDGAVQIGVGGDVVRGKAPLSKVWAKRVKTHVRSALAGDLASGITNDQKLAWVSAPVVRFGDGEPAMPMRLFAVYERAGSGWRLAVWHESVAIDAAGAGAAFKQVQAPAIVEEPPPPPKTPPGKKPGKKPAKK